MAGSTDREVQTMDKYNKLVVRLLLATLALYIGWIAIYDITMTICEWILL